jgi:hypothetical protein
MGECYAKTDTVTWAKGVPWVKTSTGGWSRAKQGYRKTAATVWTPFYTADLTPPAVPVLTTSISGTRLKIDVKAPASTDVMRVRVKVGKAVSANNATDANYIGTPDGADATWSDWNIAPSQTRTKYYPTSGALTAGTTYFVTVWAEDTSHNYSTYVSDSIKYVSSGVAAPEAHSATIDPVDSDSWMTASAVWNSQNDKYLRTGRADNRAGYLFYSTRVSSLLKGAASITSMKIQIQRYPGYDYTGATKFHLFAHSLANKPSGNPSASIVYTDSVWVSINRGQTLQVTVPTSWYANILSGKIVGLGVRSQTGGGSADTDAYAGTFYGAGTGTGRITVTYMK